MKTFLLLTTFFACGEKEPVQSQQEETEETQVIEAQGTESEEQLQLGFEIVNGDFETEKAINKISVNKEEKLDLNNQNSKDSESVEVETFETFE